MNRSRGVFIATFIFIVAAILASGPLVGVSFTTPNDRFEPSKGSIDASVVSTPDTATLEPTRYGVDLYYLQASSAELQIHDIEGQPIVSYNIVIPELGYTRSSIVFLNVSFEGSYELKFADAKIDGQQIAQSEYEGVIRIIHEGSGRVLFEKDITIEVRE